MSRPAPSGRTLLTGDEAAAHAALLSRAAVIGCYPITPQTVIVERLAELVADRGDVEFANLESEHSMFGFVIAAARAGVRTFTATSSQGLLYAHEQLHRAARERVPLVAVNVNRAILAPWSLEPDLSDSLSQRDTGWVQIYCSTVQEVLDSIVCAYRIAETAMLPVLVCAEGFLLSHTAEVLDVPDQAAVDAFLPPFRPPRDWLLDPDQPRAYSAVPARPADYAAFQRRVNAALETAGDVAAAVASEFTERFRRPKVAAVELGGNPGASTALVTLGTIGDTAKELVEDDDDLLLVRVHTYRPFPSATLRAALSRAASVAVIDRAAAFGSFGPLGSDVRALELEHAPAVTNVVCGVGGAEVTPDTLRWALDRARAGGRGNERDRPIQAEAA